MQTDLYQSLYKEMENTVYKSDKQVDMFSACNRVCLFVCFVWFFFCDISESIQYSIQTLKKKKNVIVWCTDPVITKRYALIYEKATFEMVGNRGFDSPFSFILWLFSTSLTFSESAMFKFLFAGNFSFTGVRLKASLIIYWWLQHNHFIILWEMHIAHHIEV